MFFNLVFLIGLVACRATRMELIDSYLNQMMARVGHSVNYALDKAFADSVDEWDEHVEWEIQELKMDVIDQAQSTFKPLARSILVESLTPRLQKRSIEDADAKADVNAKVEVASGPDVAPQSGEIPSSQNIDQNPDAADINVQARAAERAQEGSYPSNALNMQLAQRVKQFFIGIRDRLVRMWNAVLEALNFGRIREWFTRNQRSTNTGENMEAPKVEGDATPSVDKFTSATSASSFERFKATFSNYVSVNGVGAVLGVSFLAYLIYAFVFKKDEGEEYFE